MIDTIQNASDLFIGFGQFLQGQGILTILTLTFLSVFFAILGTIGLATTSGDVGKRLAPGAGGVAHDGRKDGRGSRSSEIIARYAMRLMNSDKEAQTKYSQRMIQAGYYEKSAIGVYYAWRIMLALALPSGFLMISPLVLPNVQITTLLWSALTLSLVGFLLPHLFVVRRIFLRQRAVREGFPDALDLLLVCVEAGLGLDAAINRVGAEIATAHPILSEQFELTALELRAGKSRADALRTLSDRVGIIELAAFVTLLNQSDALGTSIAEALRVHADEMRVNRMLRAEEKAHKLPVKLSIPLVFMVLPALMIVILAPAVIDIVNQLFPILQNTDFSILSGGPKK